jgi:hypothetical protein
MAIPASSHLSVSRVMNFAPGPAAPDGQAGSCTKISLQEGCMGGAAHVVKRQLAPALLAHRTVSHGIKGGVLLD